MTDDERYENALRRWYAQQRAYYVLWTVEFATLLVILWRVW